MKPLNSESSQQFVRFKNRDDVSKALSSIEDCMYELNEDFYDEPSFNGSVLFALDKSDPRLAGAIATAEATKLSPDRRWFPENEIKDRYVVIGSTTLAEAFKSNQPTYLQSKMNPQEHFVYTIPLSSDGQKLGALQYAIDVTSDSILGDYDMERYHRKQNTIISHITNKLGWLYDQTPSLPRSLALKDSNTPNSFIIRLDIHNSTGFINDEQQRTDFRDYLDTLKVEIAAILASDYVTNRFETLVTDQGDGQNIIFDFPKYLIARAGEADYVNYVLKTQISTIVEQIKQKHAYISTGFDFKPSLSIEEGAAFIRFDSVGDPTAKEFWDLTTKTKK